MLGRVFTLSRSCQARAGVLDTVFITPQYKLGQSFLADKNIRERIVKLGGVSRGDVVLEIGPGTGALTALMLNRGAKVAAVETDSELAAKLPRLGEELAEGKLVVFNDDFGGFDVNRVFTEGFPEGPEDAATGRVVSNIPFNITGQILRKIVGETSRFPYITLMVQEEVARRIVACPGQAEYSHVSVLSQLWRDCRYGFTVGPQCFNPRPKVSAGVITLNIRETPVKVLNGDYDGLLEMTRHIFNHKRKMARRTIADAMKASLAEVDAAMLDVGADGKARPGDLGVEQLAGIYSRLAHRANPS